MKSLFLAEFSTALVGNRNICGECGFRDLEQFHLGGCVAGPAPVINRVLRRYVR
jgi:hypothetical protein